MYELIVHRQWPIKGRFQGSSRRKRGTLFPTTLVALLFLVSCTPHLPVSLKRFIPRQKREMQRWLFDWEELAVQLNAEERYKSPKDVQLIKVLSLMRVERRKSETVSSIQQQGISYEVFRAVDGLAGFSEEVLKQYAGRKRRERLEELSTVSYEDAVQLYQSLTINGADSPLKAPIHESLRFGCFLSHVKLWQEIMDSNLPHGIILEDDVRISSNFSMRFHSLLHSLPVSWDLLYLNGCFKKFGPDFAPGVKLARGSLCTSGYAISRKAVQKLLTASSLVHSDKPIDHVLDIEISRGNIIAFHAVPPLVNVIFGLESTLAY
jgi:GR25 family glycosyltransferase involved in LPS biosynthesis